VKHSARSPNPYLSVRRKEGRVYSDEIVSQLPNVPDDHPLQEEWRARAASSHRLARYLAGLGRPLRMLDLGCGNGWLASRLAEAADLSVVGLDRNHVELDQARRVFSHRSELSWVGADIFRAPFPAQSFDIILIACAIQYFADIALLIRTLRPLLATRGEIHIVDSPFYLPQQLPAARQRSRSYYTNLGFPEMATHYHHHPSTVLDAYRPVYLYTPDKTSRHAESRPDSPFSWICIRADQ